MDFRANIISGGINKSGGVNKRFPVVAMEGFGVCAAFNKRFAIVMGAFDICAVIIGWFNKRVAITRNGYCVCAMVFKE